MRKSLTILVAILTSGLLFPSTVFAKKQSQQNPVLTFINNQSTPFNWSAPVTIPAGFKSMTWSVSSTDYIINWASQVSFDNGATWYEQHRFSCNGGNCDQVTIPVISNLYRFSLGTANGVINASAILNKEKGSKVILFSPPTNYPFASEPFNTNRFDSITITIGTTAVTQQINAISLQRKENQVFVEKERINCDGGAVCPLVSLPLLGGQYRVVLEGSGINALVAAILS